MNENKAKVGERFRKAGEFAKVLAIEPTRVQLRMTDSGNREWVDAAEFRALWKPAPVRVIS